LLQRSEENGDGVLPPHATVTADVTIGRDVDLCPSPVSSIGSAYDRGALYTLALGTSTVGTDGFLIAAILPSIAGSLGTNIQAAG
jgi:hypothetical protein